jgi:hypothetical protein
MAVYCFWMETCGWLKVGLVGPNSHARYTSQHYWGSAQSTLAGFLRADAEMSVSELPRDHLRSWIMRNTSRINILMPTALGLDVLDALESHLISRLVPRYELGKRFRRNFLHGKRDASFRVLPS